MMDDRDFYLISEGSSNGKIPEKKKSSSPITPENQKPTALENALRDSLNNSDDDTLYIVRNNDIFAVHSSDIHVGRPVKGVRTITAKKAKMVKYDSDGSVIYDD